MRIMVFAAWIAVVCFYGSTVALGASHSTDPNQYITPALESLADGTLSGLEDAYTVLNNGLNDPAVNTDPALKFWHAVARTGMMIFDTNDVSINTSLVEILEPFGVTVSGNDFDLIPLT
ncbi:MAG: hypothetical protein IIC50_24325 [Planctomycetes bacterium]|nr:hypothetical protein [Planctomycetota bacterium]